MPVYKTEYSPFLNSISAYKLNIRIKMNVSTTGKNFIKIYEKYRLDVYDDGFGFLTVGYGHKVVAADNHKKWH